jgi:hypothetical protein
MNRRNDGHQTTRARRPTGGLRASESLAHNSNQRLVRFQNHCDRCDGAPRRSVLLPQFSKDGERNRRRKSLNSLIDMSAVNQLAVSWAVSAAAIALLGLSAWRDWHRGYRRKRLDESGLEHAFGWLIEFRASLSPDDDAAVSAPTAPLLPSDQTQAAQLLRLDAALQRIETTEAAAKAGARSRELEPVPGARM